MVVSNNQSADTDGLEAIRSQMVSRLAQLEAESTSWPWTQSQLQSSLDQGHSCYRFVSDGKPVGYCVLRVSVGVLEILNLVIFRDSQGYGYGRRLLLRIIRLATEQGTPEIWLEVRESNAAARSLYQSLEFVEGTRRRNYYSNNEDGSTLEREAAILMHLSIDLPG